MLEWKSVQSIFTWNVAVRFILDDSALYLSDKCETDTVDLRRGKNIENTVFVSSVDMN